MLVHLILEIDSISIRCLQLLELMSRNILLIHPHYGFFYHPIGIIKYSNCYIIVKLWNNSMTTIRCNRLMVAMVLN
jgi:hypothetical protein